MGDAPMVPSSEYSSKFDVAVFMVLVHCAALALIVIVVAL